MTKYIAIILGIFPLLAVFYHDFIGDFCKAMTLTQNINGKIQNKIIFLPSISKVKLKKGMN